MKLLSKLLVSLTVLGCFIVLADQPARLTGQNGLIWYLGADNWYHSTEKGQKKETVQPTFDWDGFDIAV